MQKTFKLWRRMLVVRRKHERYFFSRSNPIIDLTRDIATFSRASEEAKKISDNQIFRNWMKRNCWSYQIGVENGPNNLKILYFYRLKKTEKIENRSLLFRYNRVTYMTLRKRKCSLGVNFINVLCTAFTHVDPECAKKTFKSAVSFGSFGFYEHKSCT